MEVEHVPFIFGSFTRRRQSQNLTKQQSKAQASTNIPVPNSPKPLYHHTKSKSQPEEPLASQELNNIQDRTWKTRSCVVSSPTDAGNSRRSGLNGTILNVTNVLNSRKKVLKNSGGSDNNYCVKSGEVSAVCAVCGKIYLEPRVLNCLHSFCTRCLQELVDARKDEVEKWIPVALCSSTTELEDKVSTKSNRDSSTSITSTASTSSTFKSITENNSLSSKNRLSNLTNNDNRNSCTSDSSENGGCIICPVCGVKTSLNRQGILGLPPDYVIQHRLVLSTLNDENTRLLCDLCTGEITASHRCSDCLVNLCPMCTELHHRHNNHNHELLTIQEVRQRGLMRIHRRIMCLSHPEWELTAYCNQCHQVVCAECVRLYHGNHSLEASSRAAITRANRINRILQRARLAASKEQLISDQLKQVKNSVELQCNRIEKQIEEWYEDYKKVIDKHRNTLLKQVSKICEEKLSSLITNQSCLEQHLQEANTTITFTENLLEEGSDIEILTFVSNLIKKLDKYEKTATANISTLKLNKSLKEFITEDSINKYKEKIENADERFVEFLPNEGIIYSDSQIPMIFGILNEQIACSTTSGIITNDLESLQLNKKAEFTVICKDDEGMQLKYGGEKLSVEIKHVIKQINTENDVNRTETFDNSKSKEESSSSFKKKCRILEHQVEDRKDGSYLVKFSPDAAGIYTISVLLRGKHIQDSPLTLILHDKGMKSSSCKILRPHRGKFHCCSWCSSGGKKLPPLPLHSTPISPLSSIGNNTSNNTDWNCACGGTIPGGYQGCGHGHPGHPGRKHWSCCGSVQEFGSSCNGGDSTVKVEERRGYGRNLMEGVVKTNGCATKVYHITL